MFKKTLKSEKEQLQEVIRELRNRGIEVKPKDGHGNPSDPYWSTSFGKEHRKELVIR
ncbi:hypothetical protein ACW2QC_01810 [Virgibacillus sp. FSP13]